MMTLNSHVFAIRMQMNIIKKIKNSEISMQNISNLYVCYTYKSKSKSINAGKTLLQVPSTDRSESKRIIVNACSTNESQSKSVHKSLNTREV